MGFYEKFVKLCNKKGITPARAAVEAGFTKAAPTHWKRRKTAPTDANLQKIADYFGVSVDYFADDVNFDLQMFAESKESTPQEQSLMDIYRQLDEIGRAKLLVYAASLLQ